ncbi:MAG: hypothetical protein WCX88_00090 [Patescibacteria group bacterium]
MTQETMDLNSEKPEKEMALEEIKAELIERAKKDCSNMEPAINETCPDGFSITKIDFGDKHIHKIIFYYNDPGDENHSTKSVGYNFITKEYL